MLFLFCLEVILSMIPNDYKNKANYLDNNAFQIETLILGSSHSFYGVNPVDFETKTFNASHVSQSLDYDYGILKTYEDDFKNLKTIYLPISYFTMWERLKLGSEPWRIKLYYNSYGIDANFETSDYFKFTDEPLKNLNQACAYIFKDKNNITCNNLGWSDGYKLGHSKDLMKSGVAASKRHTKDNINSSKWSKIYKENVQYLNDIITWAKENEVKVVLFTPPAYKTYRDRLNSKQLVLTSKTAKKIANENDNCSYINLMFDNDFINLDFFDSDHLNKIGAKKLSSKLKEI